MSTSIPPRIMMISTRQFEGQPATEQVAERARVVRFTCGGPGFIPKELLCEYIPEWVSRILRHVRASEKWTGPEEGEPWKHEICL